MAAEERLRIEAECQRLAIAFATYVDHRRYEEVVSLFTPDALYNPRGRPYLGREGVRAYLESRPPTRRSRHLIMNHLVEVVDATNALGTCSLVYYAHEGELAEAEAAPLAAPSLIGDYHDRYRLTDEGWRIASRVGTIVFMA